MVNNCRKGERFVMMGDFIAIRSVDILLTEHACKFGLREMNNRGNMFLDWMADNKIIAVNNCFHHRSNERYTCPSPGQNYNNQMYYILVYLREDNA